MPRLTITLPDDLYAMARAHAVATKTSISKAIGELMRQRALSSGRASAPPPDKSFQVDPVTLLPVVRGDGRKITMEDIQRAIDDDDLRIMEAAGWITPESSSESQDS